MLGLFLLVVCAIELMAVRDVNGWRPQPAKLISVNLERADNYRQRPYWLYTVQLEATGERVLITDVRPGDFPIESLFWSDPDAYAAHYKTRLSVTVFRSPEGGKAYLGRGNYAPMALLLAATLVFWCIVLVRMMRRREPELA